MEIRGFVDFYAPPSEIGGWASWSDRDNDKPVQLQVFRGSCRVGEGATSFHREDTRGQHGFRLRVADVVVPEGFVSGELTVCAVKSDGSLIPIPLLPSMLNTARLSVLRKLISSLDEEQLLKLGPDLIGSGQVRTPNLSSQSLAGADATYLRYPNKEGLSYVGTPPGHISSDHSVIVGKEGFLFIWEGSNNLIDQYRASPEQASLKKTVERWNSVVEHRVLELRKRNTKFVQMIIPEKASVIPECFPRPLPSETPLLSGINMVLKSDLVAGAYLNSLNQMRADPDRTNIFRRLDSHLSPYGAWRTFCGLLECLGHSMDCRPTFDHTIVQASDLGAKFHDLPLRERVAHPNPKTFQGLERGLQQIEIDTPADGQHLGTRVIWRNTSSPLPLRVVAFANSFFERGGSSGSLSWWAARWFQEFHFVWSPFIDHDYIVKFEPDAVVCQTIERFLPIVPRA